MPKDEPEVEQVRLAGEDHVVVSLVGGRETYRRRPCNGCPWRLDQTGVFPAAAFVHSAATSYDQSQRKFACHEAGLEHPATCAGFLLRGATHNLAVRVRLADGVIDMSQISEIDGVQLYADYRSMAVANGVDPDHPALAQCRDYHPGEI